MADKANIGGLEVPKRASTRSASIPDAQLDAMWTAMQENDWASDHVVYDPAPLNDEGKGNVRRNASNVAGTYRRLLMEKHGIENPRKIRTTVVAQTDNKGNETGYLFGIGIRTDDEVAALEAADAARKQNGATDTDES